jgi:hypothetical protein
MKMLRLLSPLGLAGLLMVFCAPARSQSTYKVGTAELSLEPQKSAFSVALAGYGVPRGGRFSISWEEVSLAQSHFKVKVLGSKWKRVVDDNHFPTGTVSVIAHRDRLLALTDQDELYRLDANNMNAEWIRFAAFNGHSYKVRLTAITVYKDKLYGLGKDNKSYVASHQTEGDLTVNAAAITEGNQSVVIVGADLCGFNADFITSIKRELFKKHGLRPEAVLINASHTHFAPASQDWTTWGSHQLPDTLYLNGMVRPAVLKVVERAMKNRKPSRISFGRGTTEIGHNRSLSGPDLPYDNDVDVLEIETIADRRKSIVFITGCHPVFKNEGMEAFTLSANYPGETRKLLKQEEGINNAMFIQGCGGDINPQSSDHIKTGTELAGDVKSILRKPMTQLTGPITFFLDTVSFPMVPWTAERIEEFRNENAKAPNDVYAEKNVRWANLMTDLNRDGKMPLSMPVFVQTINIGNWKLVGISRETVTEYSLAVKAIWPGKLVSVAGYCNDVSSYLPTSRHIKAGVYEGLDSFFWYGQPSPFPLEVQETIIEKIKTNNY